MQTTVTNSVSFSTKELMEILRARGLIGTAPAIVHPITRNVGVDCNFNVVREFDGIRVTQVVTVDKRSV